MGTKGVVEHCPFNGDMHIRHELANLMARFETKTIIETGTWSAHTTREFALMAPNVWSMDSTFEHLYEEFGPQARNDLKYRGINMVLGDSAIDLKNIIKKAVPPMLFYLDAHGGGANGSNVNPLLEELDQIGEYHELAAGPIIAIHDFFVPGKEWGYNGGDWGRGYEPLTYGLIQSRLEKIYPNGHSYHYNDKAEGMQRGIIYVYPS
jgi:hypothetical protein